MNSGNPVREVVCADSIPWMRARGCIPDACAVTSLPDVAELRVSLPAWRAWFLEAARLVMEAVPDQGAALFFQTDIRRDGAWIDKAAMVLRAAEDAGARLLFHKIVCRRPPGIPSDDRPGYTHLVAVSRTLRCPEELELPDVITDVGRRPWVRAMGIRAAAHAVRFARDHAGARLAFDPFCGVGTVLATANALGLDALGVERSASRCARARTLSVRGDEL